MPSPPTERATAALVLGVVGVIAFPPLGPAAWYLGRQARGERYARAGELLGLVGTVLLVAGVVYLLAKLVGL